MSDPVKKQEDVLKKVNRRNWLRNAVIAVSSAVVLSLTGCSKEHLEYVKGQLPGGGLGSTPDAWYILKVNYRTREGATAVGYLAPVGTQASTPYYSEMLVGGINSATKFKVSPTEFGEGWQYWQTDDGFWLSLSTDGYLYRSYQRNRLPWKIVNGKLYNRYNDDYKWQEHPAGAKYYGGVTSPFIVFGYYAGVDYGDQYVFTGCELVPAR